MHCNKKMECDVIIRQLEGEQEGLYALYNIRKKFRDLKLNHPPQQDDIQRPFAITHVLLDYFFYRKSNDCIRKKFVEFKFSNSPICVDIFHNIF